MVTISSLLSSLYEIYGWTLIFRTEVCHELNKKQSPNNIIATYVGHWIAIISELCFASENENHRAIQNLEAKLLLYHHISFKTYAKNDFQIVIDYSTSIKILICLKTEIARLSPNWVTQS